MKSIFLLFTCFCSISFGAIPQQFLSGKGAQVGGLAGTGFTLLGVKRSIVESNERVILDIGDFNGKILKGWPGYFHVELKSNPNQLVIDLAQTPNSLVDERILKAALKGSSLFSDAKIVSDPTEPNLTLILNLRKNAKVKVYQINGKQATSKIVIDFLNR